MRLPIHFVLAISTYLFIAGCDTNKPIDREAINEEIEAREIKKVSKFQIHERAVLIGNELTDKLQKANFLKLQNAMSKGGTTEAISTCALGSSNDSIATPENELIAYRVSTKTRNPNNQPDSLELLILEAYEFGSDNGLSLEPTVQDENEQVLLYTRPIIMSSGQCLSCHGVIGKDISETDYQKILTFYPNDKAIGYSVGQFRGMWSVRIPKKRIIDSL